jgi:ketosteroid isomerase-like protein
VAEQLELNDIAERLRRRAPGEWEALDGVWADQTVFWHAYDEEEIHLTGGRRGDVSRMEHAAFSRALRDFRRESTFHVSSSTGTIVETSVFSGTTPNGMRVTNPVCFVYTVMDGRIVRLDTYDDASKSRKMAEILVHSLLGDASFGEQS